MSAKICIAQKTDDSVLAMLRQAGELVHVVENDPKDMLEKLRQCDAVILGTWFRMTREVMAETGKLRVISRTGVGVDTVDVDAASERGITVLYTPGVNALSVAEHALMLLLALAKAAAYLDRESRTGNFAARRLDLPTDLDGKVLGVVGWGAIGRMLAAKCRAALNMSVLAYDPLVSDFGPEAERVESLDELFARADCVSLHVPSTPETRGMVTSGLLGKMKPGAFLINTARGDIVDEQALYEALSEKRIGGAGLDVFAAEPPAKENPLLRLDNVIVTPHSAALTRECRLRVARCAAEGIVDFLAGRTPKYVYKPGRR